MPCGCYREFFTTGVYDCPKSTWCIVQLPYLFEQIFRFMIPVLNNRENSSLNWYLAKRKKTLTPILIDIRPMQRPMTMVVILMMMMVIFSMMMMMMKKMMMKMMMIKKTLTPFPIDIRPMQCPPSSALWPWWITIGDDSYDGDAEMQKAILIAQIQCQPQKISTKTA